MAHDKTLTELKWFKWALWGPIGTGVLVATAIGIADFTNEDLRVCFTSACVNDAIGRLKFPLAIASLAFPLVALVASHHRSVQTAAQISRSDKQIEATDKKNSFENCIKHRGIFMDFLSDIEKREKIKFISKEHIYTDIFAQNDYTYFSYYCDDMQASGDPSILDDGLVSYENFFHKIYFHLVSLNDFWDEDYIMPDRKPYAFKDNMYSFSRLVFPDYYVGERLSFDYSSIEGRLQNDYYLMLSILDTLEYFCLSKKYLDDKCNVFNKLKSDFYDRLHGYSQHLTTERVKVRAILNDKGETTGFEQILDDDDELIPF
ncbi:hypothetical protein [Marinomonas mediterranea]|uniref:Uncharacterized protein n=1 Tax=Marinomonas mediterranea (strain ATCC 700492 / JCM 21426 / NBRC 103028 / MMB-1) TaxID=717774 RepID=F2JW11_MARM1|nr:hypothetical protein [Marinomonas mediterranea]ADZ92899.1 hypothetical protein Marme_3688 [Marinomonas mediterranea MMB-1]WCN18921.1 hypothetical protein GV053_18680 [Marinomonas mediterranea MMB-1]